MNSNAGTESEKFFPEHMQGDDDQPMVINNEDLFIQGWKVSATGFTGSGGSAGSKGMFVETSDSDSENGSDSTGNENTFTNSGNNEDLFRQVWIAHATGFTGGGSAGSKGMFVEIRQKDPSM